MAPRTLDLILPAFIARSRSPKINPSSSAWTTRLAIRDVDKDINLVSWTTPHVEEGRTWEFQRAYASENLAQVTLSMIEGNLNFKSEKSLVWSTQPTAQRLSSRILPATIHAMSADGKFTYISDTSAKYPLQKLDAQTFAIEWQSPLPNRLVQRGAISPDGRWFAFCTDLREIIITDNTTGKTHHSFTGLGAVAGSIVWSPDTEHFITGSPFGDILLWDLDPGDVPPTVVQTLPALVPANSGMLLDQDEGTILLYNSATHTKVRSLQTLDLIRTIDDISLGGWSEKGQLWWLNANQQLMRGPVDQSLSPTRIAIVDPDQAILDCSASPDGRWLVAQTDDNQIAIWDRHNDSLVRRRALGYLIASVAIDNEGSVYLASGDQRLQRWAPGEPQPGLALQLNWRPHGLEISPDSRFLVTISTFNDSVVYSTEDLSVVANLKGSNNTISGIAFHPDEKQLVCAGTRGALLIFNTEDWAQRPSLNCAPLGSFEDRTTLKAVKFLPDGRALFARSRLGRLRIWRW
ncbi:MAG: WD40 repeat domain-containing protein [Candidatus Synoicihabitans palmerolidicus]|nr:WD40 repeat domain-containing protein [Candidatus Synoicihabitans palmerolidicus]